MQLKGKDSNTEENIERGEIYIKENNQMKRTNKTETGQNNVKVEESGQKL